MPIHTFAFARAGLMGNPSDAYGGKALAVTIPALAAEVTLEPSSRIEVLPAPADLPGFESLQDLSRTVRLHGYYGGVRLVMATVKRFVDYCEAGGLEMPERGFRIGYQSAIPRQVGLAGSSAIVVAALRALVEFFEVEIPLRVQPSLALSVETEELGIPAGLMDRAVQVYEGLLALDLTDRGTEAVHGYRCGTYEPLDRSLLPPLYVAYARRLAEPTERVHGDLSERYVRGDRAVLEAMESLAGLADAARAALTRGDTAAFAAMMDRNFELRRSICALSPWQVEMVEAARAAGATAKFAGSGGAIVGAYPDSEVLDRLKGSMASLDCEVILLDAGS